MMHKALAFLAITFLGTSAFAAGEATHSFTGKEAAEIVGRALMKEGTVDEVRVQIDGIKQEDQLAAAPSAIVAAADSLHVDKTRSRWNATLLMSADGKSLAPVKLSGHYDEMAHVPVLKTRMQSGDIITEDDIVWDDVPAAHLRKAVITDIKSLVGKTPRRVVSAGRPVRIEEISGPTVISKGSQVTLVYKTAHLEIKTLGEALENGALGTVIRVKNVSSKSVIQGVVVSEGLVRIGSPDSLSAGLM